MSHFAILHILKSIVKVNMELEESIIVDVDFWAEFVEPSPKSCF